VLAALVAGSLWFSAPKEESAPAAAEIVTEQPSIAVLPLTDLGPDGRDAALADGMTEELIGILTRTGAMRVIASTSVFALEGSQLDVRQIGDSLGVSNLLEGSLQKIGNRLRVQVRLVDARDGSTRWSEIYEREFEDVFAVQGEITRAVARELDLRLETDTEANLLRPEKPNIAAYELYLRGSDQSLLRSDSGIRRGVEYFEQALAVDSTYAAPYAGLARLRLLASFRVDPRTPDRELLALAEQAATKSVALEDSLGEAHAVLGLVRWYAAYDFASAETELTRAIDLDPSDALFRQWLAQLCMQTGRFQDALPPARRAVEIDPLSPSAHAELAHALLVNGRYDEALARLERIAAVQPPLRRAAPYAAQAYAMKGMWSEAIETLRPYTENGDSRTLSAYGYLLARAGRRDEAARIRETLLEGWPRGESGAFDIAIIHAGLDDFDQAFVWLDRSIADRSLLGHSFNIMEPIFEELSSDPRFERIRERLGFQKR
jgi:TolB-like protein/Flp pilus assembly protein TadD